MTSPRRPGSSRPPASARGAGSGRRAVPAGGETHGRPPLERRQAATALVGLAAFGLGFAVAGILVALRQGGTPAYWTLVSLGLLGIGAVGLAQPRSLAESARPPIWSRAGLGDVAEPLGLPRRLVVVGFYVLVAIGVVGNVVVPIVLGRR